MGLQPGIAHCGGERFIPVGVQCSKVSCRNGNGGVVDWASRPTAARCAAQQRPADLGPAADAK